MLINFPMMKVQYVISVVIRAESRGFRKEHHCKKEGLKFVGPAEDEGASVFLH